MKRTEGIIVGFHLFVGLGGFAGGLAAVLNPFSPLGMPTTGLERGPFRSFLIPGLFLMLALGGGNLATAIAFIFGRRWRELVSGGLGLTLQAWIVIQCWILNSVYWLHVVFFLVGVLQTGLALLAIRRIDVAPWNFVRAYAEHGSGAPAQRK